METQEGKNKKALKAIEDAKKSDAKTLDLSYINLSEIPESLSELKKLQKLKLENTGLKSFPEIVTTLPNLRVLSLEENEISHLPDSIAKLTQLRELNLEDSGLESISESIGELVNLRSLNLCHNKFNGLPDSIVQLKSLKELNLSANKIKKLPDGFHNLKKLQNLEMGSCDLDSNILSIFKIVSLRLLNLSRNNIDVLPSEIAHLKNLRTLILRLNNLGTLPWELSKLKKLTSLDVGMNHLKIVPDVIPKLKSLKWLSLEKAVLTDLPENFHDLKKLEDLYLCTNEIEVFPEVITKLCSLKKLYIFENKIKTIPLSIINLKNLEFLHISFNQLESIPECIGQLENLKALWVTENFLTQIPESIGQLMNLEELALEGNNIKNIPNSIAGLPNLKKLDIDKGNLEADSPFLESGFVGVYKKLLEGQRERIRVKIVEIADGLKGLFQEYLADFENFLKETEQILIRFSTKQVDQGLELEIELPVVHDEEMENSIQRAFDKYLALIYPSNQDKLQELLNDYFKEASKYTILHYQNKIQHFQQNLLVAQERMAEKQNQLLSTNENIEGLKGLLQESIKKIESRKFETSSREMEVKELVNAVQDFKNFIDPSLKFELVTNESTLFLKYDDIIMFHIRDEEGGQVYCYNLNKKRMKVKEVPGVTFDTIPVNHSIGKIMETWGKYFIWVNKQTVINPRHIYSRSNDGDRGIIEMDSLNFTIDVSRDKRGEIWWTIENHTSLKP